MLVTKSAIIRVYWRQRLSVSVVYVRESLLGSVWFSQGSPRQWGLFRDILMKRLRSFWVGLLCCVAFFPSPLRATAPPIKTLRLARTVVRLRCGAAPFTRPSDYCQLSHQTASVSVPPTPRVLLHPASRLLRATNARMDAGPCRGPLFTIAALTSHGRSPNLMGGDERRSGAVRLVPGRSRGAVYNPV